MEGIGGDQFYRQIGFSSAEKVAELQKQRTQYNQQVKAQHAQNIMSGAATGATIGATYGTAGGPWGIAIGTVVGGLAGAFL